MALVFAISLITTPTQAQPRTIFVTGNDLKLACTENVDMCGGYITGMADTFESFAWPMPRTCRTKAVTLQEVVEFALLTLGNEQTDLKRPAVNILGDAFSDKWPC